jgi:hypothetical protein
VVQILVSFICYYRHVSRGLSHFPNACLEVKCEVEGVVVLVLILHVERMWGEAGLRHSFTHS